MAYFDIEFYRQNYGDIDEKAFNRLSFDACRKLDNHTTGADGVKKLRHAFPVDEDDIEAVKRCGCKLVHLMTQMEAAEQSMGYEATENGTRGKVISSVSAGNESISYSVGNATMIDKALSDPAVKEKLFRDTIREYLSGVADANGVSLLYMGVYPRV
jgi:hypothetical protein